MFRSLIESRRRFAAPLIAAGMSALFTAGCASSGSSDGAGNAPDRKQERPPAAGDLPPPPAPGTIGLGDGIEAENAVAFRERAIATLLELTRSPDAQVRGNAVEALLSAPTRLAPQMPALLGDANEGVRAVAAVAVGEAEMTTMVPLLVPMTREPSPYVRASAIYALARCGEPVDQSPLATILLTHQSMPVRAHTATLLGKLGNPTALPMLREAAGAPSARASRNEWRLFDLQIAEAMVRLGDETRLAVLRSALYQTRAEDIELALVAVQILGSLNDRASRSSMINLAGQTDRDGREMPLEVQLAVASALARMQATANEGLAISSADHSDSLLRAGAAHALLGAQSQGGRDALARLMADNEAQVRVAAAASAVRLTSTGRTPRSATFSAGSR